MRVPRKADGREAVGVAQEDRSEVPRLGVPEADRAVFGSGGDPTRIGREAAGDDPIFVGAEALEGRKREGGGRRTDGKRGRRKAERAAQIVDHRGGVGVAFFGFPVDGFGKDGIDRRGKRR